MTDSVSSKNSDHFIKPTFKPIGFSRKSGIKTAVENMRSKSLDFKRPTMTNINPENEQSQRIEKLGLEDYVMKLITSRKDKESGETSNRFISESINKTWVNRDSQDRPNTYYFESSMGSRRELKSPEKKINVDWSQTEEGDQNWREMNRISHYQFPCRKQSKLLKGRFYSNTPNKLDSQHNTGKIEFPDEESQYAKLNVRDITGNANKLFKRLVNER